MASPSYCKRFHVLPLIALSQESGFTKTNFGSVRRARGNSPVRTNFLGAAGRPGGLVALGRHAPDERRPPRGYAAALAGCGWAGGGAARLPRDLLHLGDDTQPQEREAAEKALAHEVGNKVFGAYRRSDLFDRRVPLMRAPLPICRARPSVGPATLWALTGHQCATSARGLTMQGFDQRLRQLASTRRRFGWRRLHILLAWEPLPPAPV